VWAGGGGRAVLGAGRGGWGGGAQGQAGGVLDGGWGGGRPQERALRAKQSRVACLSAEKARRDGGGARSAITGGATTEIVSPSPPSPLDTLSGKPYANGGDIQGWRQMGTGIIKVYSGEGGAAA